MESGRSPRLSKLVGAALAIILLAGAAGYSAFAAQRARISPLGSALPSLPALDLKNGDLVFRTGRDVMARLILSQGDEARFSHVGVIVLHGHEAFVVHALPADDSGKGGVQEEPLAEFSAPNKASDLGFYRQVGISERSRQKIVDYVVKQIGKPFDDEFRFSDDSRFYCTELALKAIAAAGRALSPSVDSVRVLTLSEPVFPPDFLRRSPQLVEIAVLPERTVGREKRFIHQPVDALADVGRQHRHRLPTTYDPS
jgi:hypothetical protein